MPTVSVVMSVYNDEQRVTDSVNSILNQTFTDFEFIIINDGSTDSTGEILENLAKKDSRIRVIHQKNTGLTKALIHGCAEAQGLFIGRQDSGDISLLDRLEIQVEYLSNDPNVVMVSSSVRFAGPKDEFLFDVVKQEEEISNDLNKLDVYQIAGPPHHGATMFRRDAYIQVGGYHSIFTVAQDIDLWLRLSEVGFCRGLPHILYQAKLIEGGISVLKRSKQYQLGELAIRCAKLRRSGLDEKLALDAFHLEQSENYVTNLNQSRSKFYYFLGSCLKFRQPLSALGYYAVAMKFYIAHLFSPSV